MTETVKTAEQLDAEVQAAKTELEARRADAEKIVERLLAALGPALQSYFEQTIANIATEEHEVTTKLGAQLSTVKQELKTIASLIPDKVREWIGTDDHWPHRAAYRHTGSNGPQNMREKFEKSLTSFVSSKMSRYGYKAQHYYAGKAAWKGEPETITAEYKTALDAFNIADTRYRNAVNARQRFEAKSLWDKA